MIVLREMREEEYPAFCEYFIDDYSNEISQNYGHSLDVAVALAKKDLRRSFPNGLENNEHELLCIEATVDRQTPADGLEKNKGKKKVVGYLWHSINRSENLTFIYDFYISDEYRGHGIGKLAISALEAQLQSMGIDQIKLRVAYHNKRALKLYQEVGFVITGFNLSKKLD